MQEARHRTTEQKGKALDIVQQILMDSPNSAEFDMGKDLRHAQQGSRPSESSGGEKRGSQNGGTEDKRKADHKWEEERQRKAKQGRGEAVSVQEQGTHQGRKRRDSHVGSYNEGPENDEEDAEEKRDDVRESEERSRKRGDTPHLEKKTRRLRA